MVRQHWQNDARMKKKLLADGLPPSREGPGRRWYRRRFAMGENEHRVMAETGRGPPSVVA